jgi:hypothetical protein
MQLVNSTGDGAFLKLQINRSDEKAKQKKKMDQLPVHVVYKLAIKLTL